jgi:predicted transposase YbfD/YdcC
VSLFHCEFRPSSRDACDACGRPQYADISSLLDMLKSVPEPRGRRGRQYALEFILAVCIVATLSGAKNYREIATCAAGMPESLLRELGGKQDWFSRRWKSPCAGTIRLVLAKIDAAALDRITGGWLLTQARKHRRGGENAEWVIAVDGKVMRGAWTSENDKVTMFSAMLHEESVTIAQVRVPDGTNETTQVKALAHAAGIPDGEIALFTMDAAHISKKMARAIAGTPQWDYLVKIKRDKGTLYRQVKEIISPVLEQAPRDVMKDRSRGRVKTWSCWTADAAGIKFPHIAQIACICCEVSEASGSKISKDISILLTSRAAEKMTAADLSRKARGHWGIENKSHYIRDTVYREDHGQAWVGNGPQSLASLRNISIGLLRMKGAKNIKEATEQISYNLTRALIYMTT